ncbi:hypothetical protein [Microbacterium suwonense]|uniref:hypothetical protein n=1 Tax=Microbacterium suwonense TaxID=683047 RepID=UPI002572BA4B|nr:hypothetical protein [Microbacterium suwonense]
MAGPSIGSSSSTTPVSLPRAPLTCGIRASVSIVSSRAEAAVTATEAWAITSCIMSMPARSIAPSFGLSADNDRSVAGVSASRTRSSVTAAAVRTA